MAAESARHVGGDEVASAVLRRKAAVAAGSGRLCGIFFVVGFKGEDEGICAMHISGGGVEPTHHPCAKSKSRVDPIFGVIVFFFAWGGFMS